MSSISSLRCWGSHVFPIFLEMSGKSCLPCLCLRCQGRHVFPVFLEMSGRHVFLSLAEMLGKTCLPCLPIFPNLLGKTSLPHLPLRCWGRHVFPVFPEMLGKTFGDVGEDTWRWWGRQEHWGRHSRLSGRTSRRMGMTLGGQGGWGRHRGRHRRQRG